MNKNKKRILGLLGLVLVAAMTIFAIFLPSSEASATDNYSSTDTINVRVVGDSINVDIKEPKNGSVFVAPKQILSFDYENARIIHANILNKDTGQIHNLVDEDVGYIPGTKQVDLDLLGNGYGYGYGEYKINVKGEDYNDVYDEDNVEFSFLPVIGSIEESENDGLFYLNLNYDTAGSNIGAIEINIYDKEGNRVNQSPINVNLPNTTIELPFSEYNIASGDYKVEIVAYSDGGSPLYKPYNLYVSYEVTLAPDTGGFLNNLNISETDYIITALILFSFIIVVGFILITKSKKR